MRGREYSGTEALDPSVREVPGRYNRAGDIRSGYDGIRLVKKLGEAGDDARKAESSSAVITLDEIILAGLERGLTITEMRKMQLGQIVDFCISYNERQKEADKQQKKAEKAALKRKASQGDINAFFG